MPIKLVFIGICIHSFSANPGVNKISFGG